MGVGNPDWKSGVGLSFKDKNMSYKWMLRYGMNSATQKTGIVLVILINYF